MTMKQACVAPGGTRRGEPASCGGGWRRRPHPLVRDSRRARLERGARVRQEPPALGEVGKSGWPCASRSPTARASPSRPGKPARVLNAGLLFGLRSCVSMDGRRVLFAGGRGPRALDILEVGADGTGLRRVTEGLGDCFEPCYLPAAPSSAGLQGEGPLVAFAFHGPGKRRRGRRGEGDLPSRPVLEPVPGQESSPGDHVQPLERLLSTVLSDGRSSTRHGRNSRPGSPRTPAGRRGRQWTLHGLVGRGGREPFLPGRPGLVRSMACETPDRQWCSSSPTAAGRQERRARPRLPAAAFATHEAAGKGPAGFRDRARSPTDRLLSRGRPREGFGSTSSMRRGRAGEWPRGRPGWSDVTGPRPRPARSAGSRW